MAKEVTAVADYVQLIMATSLGSTGANAVRGRTSDDELAAVRSLLHSQSAHGGACPLPAAIAPSEARANSRERITESSESITRFSLDELARKVALAPRTVRAYQTRGLISRPTREGRRAVYGIEHVQQLEAIQQARAAGVSLELLSLVTPEGAEAILTRLDEGAEEVAEEVARVKEHARRNVELARAEATAAVDSSGIGLRVAHTTTVTQIAAAQEVNAFTTVRTARTGTGTVVVTSDDWAARGACRTTDPDFVQGAAQNRAKAICMSCSVRTECLADALDNRIEFGVLGGMTERERRALLRRRPRVASWRKLLETARAEHERLVKYAALRSMDLG
jgi:WhiB family redox-sensing transcriptional regulator